MKIKATTGFFLVLLCTFVVFQFLPEKSKDSVTKDLPLSGSFSKRLRNLGSSQEEVSAALIANMPSTLALEPEGLDSSQRDSITSLAVRQHKITNDLKSIQADLQAYLANNEDRRYSRVLDAIRQSGIERDLRVIEEHIKSNLAYPAADTAKSCAERIRIWADQLKEFENND